MSQAIPSAVVAALAQEAGPELAWWQTILIFIGGPIALFGLIAFVVWFGTRGHDPRRAWPGIPVDENDATAGRGGSGPAHGDTASPEQSDTGPPETGKDDPARLAAGMRPNTNERPRDPPVPRRSPDRATRPSS
jgi:hypothetical protein